MGFEWATMALGAAGVKLIDCDHRTPPVASNGLPYLAIPQMKSGRLDLADARLISIEDFTEWTKKADPRQHDVVLSRRCNPGVTAPVPNGARFALGQNLVLLRADGTKVFPPFLRWLVSSPDWWEQIGKFINVGAVFDSLRCADVPKFELSMPPLPEQRRIAAVLAALDDKIELNRKMNRTLEQMAQAIFKSWFIDFDGHDPADMVESELGLIPRGWNAGVLEHCLVLQRGFDLPATERTPGPFPILSSGGPSGSHSEPRVKGPGVVTGRSGKLGDVYLVHEDFWPLNTTLWIKEYRRSSPHHAFHLLQTLGLERFNAGSAVPTLNRNHVHGLPLPIPPAELVAQYDAIARPLFDRHRVNTAQSRTLTTLRDTLLPKLISGEIRVPDAEEAAAEATV